MGGREHLIVVLPGIGGSRLAIPDDPQRVVWSAGFRDVGNVLLRPQQLSLDEHPQLDPVGLIPTRKLFGVWTAVPGYDRLLKRLAAIPDAVLDDGTPAGRNLDANVVAIPYDFRRGVRHAAQRLDDEVRQRLRQLWPPTGQSGSDGQHESRIVIIAHSLGGLVARYWCGPGGGGALCRGLITLGTPHRGAPKALDLLANGVRVGPFRLTRPVPVLRDWPSVFELLPRYPAVLDVRPEPLGGELGGGGGPTTVGRRLRPHQVGVSWLTAPGRAAGQLHQEIEEDWRQLPVPPAVYPRIGYGHGTLRACTWDGQRLRVTTDVPPGDDSGQWTADEGDGTVPAFCGLPVELDRQPGIGLRVGLRHGAIAELDELEAILASFEGSHALTPYRGGDERPAVLGLHVEELQLAGRAFDVACAVRGTDDQDGMSAVDVWAVIEPVDRHMAGLPPREFRMDWDGSDAKFHGAVPALPPGAYRLAISADEVPRAGALHSSQLIEVVDGDHVE